jgi:Ca2+-binding RTX toxin-like protein
VGLPGSYDANEGTVSSGERFELVPLSDQTNNTTFGPLQAESIANSITQFRRVEDGHFDPNHPDDFYFVTTDAFGGATRLWRLRFDDITHPEAGGVIDVIIDGANPASPVEMLDNMTVDALGNAMLQEDVGNQVRLGKIWQYKLGTGDLIEVARHNPDFFLDTDPGTPGVQSVKDLNPSVAGNQGTQDEESSGIIDLSAILGEGHYLANVQAHLSLGGELVEAGQLLVINTNMVSAELVDGVLKVQGSINNDVIEVSRHGNTLKVKHDGDIVGQFHKRDVDKILIDASFGNDLVWIDNDVQQAAVLLGGGGHDLLRGGKGRSILIGGTGVDLLLGNSDSDILIGGTTVYDADHEALCEISDAWGANRPYRQRVNNLRSLLNSATVLDDGQVDVLFGAGSLDWFFSSPGDILLGSHLGEQVN